MIFPLLLTVALSSSSWAKPVSVRLPPSTESFRVARTNEILRSRGVAVEALPPGEDWDSLTPDEQNEIRADEQRLIQINHLSEKIFCRPGGGAGVLPAQARDQIRRFATGLAEWSGEHSLTVSAALSVPLEGCARTADRLSIHNMGSSARFDSLENRLRDLAEGVSLNTQRALLAANVTHDPVALREAEAANVRLIAEAYLVTGMGQARLILHSAARLFFHYALAALPVFATNAFYQLTGVEWPWLISTFVGQVATVLVPLEYASVYIWPEAKFWFYPERLRATVNRIFIGDMTEPSFWRLVRKNLESAAGREPASGTSPLKQFLLTWAGPRRQGGSTVSYLTALQKLTGLSPRRVLPAVFPSCAVALGGEHAP